MNYFIYTVFVFIALHLCKASDIKNNENYFPELKYINENIKPCDNFYEFACGNFEKYNPLPEKELLWDNFKIVQKKINNFTANILKSNIRLQDAEAVKKAKDMFFACTNPKLSAEQSMTPLLQAFDKLGGWPLVSDKSERTFSWDFLGEIISEFGLPIIFSWDISPYYYDPSIYMMAIDKDALKLPVNAVAHLEDFQNEIDINSKAENIYRPYYMQYLIDVAKKFVRPDHMSLYEERIEKGIERAYDILVKISNLTEIDMNEDEYGDIYTLQNLQDWTDTFQSEFKTKINWITFFKKAYSKTNVKITGNIKVNVSQQYVIKALLTLIENTPNDVIMNFIFTRLITHSAQDTNSEMWEMFNELYRKLKYTVYSREEYCMRKVTSYPGIGLSLAVAHEYQNYHFDLRKISKPREIIEDMMKSFFELLDENTWVDDKVRQWVRTKAQSMLQLIAFPDYVYDKEKLDDYYKDLEVCSHDHYGNSQRIRAFNFAKSIEILDKPRKRDIWSQSPLISNAFYNAGNNRIIFPSGIMDIPFFTGKSKLVDYSRIGALIGHEITHGFDSKGRNRDGNGTYVQNAWSEIVDKSFNNRSSCFIKQYSNYTIEEIGQNVNGDQTNTENIADNGGLREAYRAYKKLNNNSTYPPEYFKGKYTTDQLFFISYATMWCKVDTKQSLEMMNAKDDHAPNRFRVIGTLSNMQEFADVFSCPKGSNMNPEHKCVLW